MASGGLSHVVIDEEIDQMTLDGLKNKMRKSVAAAAGTTVGRNLEILNWSPWPVS
jgi:hypothetical protein